MIDSADALSADSIAGRQRWVLHGLLGDVGAVTAGNCFLSM
jgi:hypothetical protein